MVYSKLKKYRFSDAINVLSRIDLKLGYHQAGLFDRQVELLDNMGYHDIINKYNLYIKAHPEVQQLGRQIFFHEHQIYNAVKLCLRHCTFRRTKIRKGAWRALVDVLLIINDHLTPHNIEKLPRKQIEKMQILQYFIRNALFHKQDGPRHLISRWYELVFESYKLLSKDNPNYIDLETSFTTRYGMKPYDYLNICLALFTCWFGLEDRQINSGEVTLDSAGIKAKYKMNKRVFNKVLKEVSATIRWYRQKIPETKFNPYDFLPLQKKPVLRKKSSLHCLSKKFLVEKFTTAFYHMMIDCFSGSHVDDFLTFFGEIYENYLKTIFDNEFNRSKVNRLFFGSLKYKKGRNSIESCDGIIDHSNSLLVMEFKAKLFAYDFLAKGKDKYFQNKFNEIIFRSARELNTTIDDFNNGILLIPGINNRRIKYFFPVIISLQPIPMIKILNNHIADELKKKGYLQQPNVAKIEIIDTYELEIMLAIRNHTGKSLVDLIKEKRINGFDDFSISDYIFQKYTNMDLSPKHIKDKFNQIVQQYLTFWQLKKGSGHTIKIWGQTIKDSSE